jgi:hypothetical protein
MRARLLLVMSAALYVTPAVAQETLYAFPSESALVSELRRLQEAEDSVRAHACRSGPTLVDISRRAGGAGAVVTGIVRGSNGAAGGTQLRADAINAAALSAPDGTFRLNIPSARLTGITEVTLTASRLGLVSQSRRFRLAEGDSVNVTFGLCPNVVALEGFVATAMGSESVTNTQEEGVDEGGIVKLHGEHLVVLRRGRLYTVSIGHPQMRPVSMVNAYAPGAKPGWYYDEMLVYRDRVVVIGLGEEGTELNLFHIDPRGRLRWQSSYHLRSDDYYSSRNYATRLIGNRLVLYTPLSLRGVRTAEEFRASLPAIRRWRRHQRDDDFTPTVSTSRIFSPGRPLEGADGLSLHTVTECPLDLAELRCRSTVLVGPGGRVFYVSPEAVYVWVNDSRGSRRSDGAASVLYRLPLNGSSPTLLATRGSPIDQFSFLEKDGWLNVLVRSQGGGDGMWSSDHGRGLLSLLRVPISAFGGAHRVAPLASYLGLPLPPNGYSVVNRFVGSTLLYGSGNGWMGSGGTSTGGVFALHLGASQATEIPLVHGVDRIEVMGNDAVVIGAGDQDLYFTAVRLTGTARAAYQHVETGASQGETRSHGFFYKPDAAGGMLGLPVSRPVRPGFQQLWDESSAVVFVRNEDGRFRALGDLEARPEHSNRDNCQASCADWYGNSRPLFIRGRLFALLGYEIVEGRIARGRVTEVQRVSFSPSQMRISNR